MQWLRRVSKEIARMDALPNSRNPAGTKEGVQREGRSYGHGLPGEFQEPARLRVISRR